MKVKGLMMAVVASQLVALILLGCSSNTVRPSQEAVSHYKMGLNRMQANNDEAALYEFNIAIDKDPSNPDAHFGAGIIQLLKCLIYRRALR